MNVVTNKLASIGSLLTGFVRINHRLSSWVRARWPGFFRAERYKEDLRAEVLVACRSRERPRLLEVGGIDRPLFERSPEYVLDGLDIQYKESCSRLYDNFVVGSIEEPLENKYDVIFSLTLLEHVRNNTAAIGTIFRGLKAGGETHHYLPCKNHPYALCLRMVGPRFQRKLIQYLRPWAGLEETGYPTFFDHCSSKEMRRLLCQSGFENVEIKYYYRANDYFAFFFPLYLLIGVFGNICKVLNWKLFCAGMLISARKGVGSVEPGKE